MMIFSLVAMTGLEKCCITSAYLQGLCHSGERPVARGSLVTVAKKLILPHLADTWDGSEWKTVINIQYICFISHIISSSRHWLDRLGVKNMTNDVSLFCVGRRWENSNISRRWRLLLCRKVKKSLLFVCIWSVLLTI